MLKKTLLTAAAVAMLSFGPAVAQNTNVDAGGGKGLVVVDVNALNSDQIDVLRNANIEVLNGNTVQVPINVAATLCDTKVNVIASSNDRGNKTCTATAAGVAKFQG